MLTRTLRDGDKLELRIPFEIIVGGFFGPRKKTGEIAIEVLVTKVSNGNVDLVISEPMMEESQ